MSNVRRNVTVRELTKAEISLRKLTSDNLRTAIALYLQVMGETEPHAEEALRKLTMTAVEESLGITGRELPG